MSPGPLEYVPLRHPASLGAPPSLEVAAAPALGPDQAQVIARTLAGMDPWVTLGYSAEALASSLQAVHPDLTRYLAVRDGETLGLAVVRHPWLRGAYIELFAVLPGAQGHGVGRALLGHVEATYRGRAGNLWLLVSGFNSRARRFYEGQGFREIGLIADLVVPGQDEVLMRKVLQDLSRSGAARPIPDLASGRARPAAIGQQQEDGPEGDHGRAQDLAHGQPVEGQVAELGVGLTDELRGEPE
jgi:ribosomal protein S18 acetylase RimI-like enzyme